MDRIDEWGLTEQDRKAMRRYMRQNWQDSWDHAIDMVSPTQLAEDCAWNMPNADDAWLDDSTHPIWDIAAQVSDEAERWLQGKAAPLNDGSNL